MNPEHLLSELSVKIYEPPLSEIRDSGRIADLSSAVSVLMLFIDFETEVMMNGIADFLGNSTGLYARQTVSALQIIGCPVQADALGRILTVAHDAGMTYEAIQADRSGLKPYAITSFAELHGDKWNAALEQIYELENQIDYQELWAKAGAYVASNQAEIETAVDVKSRNA